MNHARHHLRRALGLLLALALLSALAGCGGAQLKTGKQIMRKYLSGRGAEITECYVELLRPDGTKPVASDFVKGSFRADGADYEFAVNTVTGAVYTSERMPELAARCASAVLARLGLDAGGTVADCLVERRAQPWQTPNAEWPWARSYLGHVLPVSVTDLDACAAQALADEDARVLLYLACPADALYEGHWTADTLVGWENVEVELFGFTANEALPGPDTFPGAYLYASDRPRLTLRPGEVDFRP